MAKNVTRAVVYARDLKRKDGKFDELDAVIRSAKATNKFALMVRLPQMLGDTYDELITNLDKIAAADLALMIVPPNHR